MIMVRNVIVRKDLMKERRSLDMYNETLVLNNKIEALTKEVTRLLDDNIRLQEISQIVRVPDLSDEFKVKLIVRILKREGE
jgi:hypothetical protein